MLLSGNLKPPTVILLLLVSPPPGVLPQAAAITEIAASAATSHREARLVFIKSLHRPERPLEVNPGPTAILPTYATLNVVVRAAALALRSLMPRGTSSR